ncbi:MAG: nagA [Chlamydiia bacterium]|nr:nagA [Chlamydiia bacterium]
MTLLSAISLPLLAALPPVEAMTIEEKVGQTLIAHFNGEEVNQDAQTLVHDIHIGGVIYYNWANGLHSPQQVQKLSNGLQKFAEKSSLKIPLFISVDQEGGVVARLTKGFTQFPGNRALGIADDAELSEACALAMGEELKAVGVNFNLAPVVDIASNPASYIGIRAAGDTAEKVIRIIKPQLAGFRRAGIITSLKHFPGHGDVTIDSHQDLPLLEKSQEELRGSELVPYMKLAASADTIMTAHIVVPAFDAKKCATLSPAILEGLLRDEINYKGVVISDSLVMEGVLKNCASIDEAAIIAFNAGCDIIMLGGKQLVGTKQLELTVADIQRIFASMVNAVRTGRISEERLNRSVKRILDLKSAYKIDSFSYPGEEDIKKYVATKEHQELAAKIATLSTKVVTTHQTTPYQLDQKKVLVLAPAAIRDVLLGTTIKSVGRNANLFFTESLAPTAEEKAKVLEMTKDADAVIICSYNAWKNAEQKALIETAIDSGKSVIVISVRDPQDAELFPKARTTITTCSPTTPSIQAALNLLKNE